MFCKNFQSFSQVDLLNLHQSGGWVTSLWFTGSEATNWFNAGKNQCVSFLRRRTPVTGSRTGSEGAQRSNIRCQWVCVLILQFNGSYVSFNEMGCLHSVRSMYVTLKEFTPDLQIFYNFFVFGLNVQVSGEKLPHWNGRFHKALPNVKSAYNVTLHDFTPDLKKMYTDISAISVTLCNSASEPKDRTPGLPGSDNY